MAKPNQILIEFKPQGHSELIKAIERLATAQKKLNGSMKKLGITTGDVTKKSGMLDTRNKRLAKTNGLLANSFATIRSKMLLVSFAMSLGIRQLMQMSKEAANLQGMETAFNTLAGGTENATVAIDKLREATNNTMSDFDLFQQANNAMILGVSKNSDEMAEMFDIAQRLGNALGKDTRMSVESLITGIGRQSRMMLDNIGIIVKSDEAYKAYAQSLGKSADDLTDLERKQAFLNATMESARTKVADLNKETDTARTSFQQLEAATKNLQTRVGEAALSFEPLVEGITKFLDAITHERIDRFFRSLKFIGETLLKTGAIIGTVSALFMSFGEILAVVGTVLAAIYSSWILLIASVVGGTYALLTGKDALEGYLDPTKDLTAEQRRLNILFEAGATTLVNQYVPAIDSLTDAIGSTTNAMLAQEIELEIIDELYKRTKQGQIDAVDAQLATIDAIGAEIGMTEKLSAVYAMLIEKKGKLTEQSESDITAREEVLKALDKEKQTELELLQTKIQIGQEVLGQFNSMTSALSTHVNTRMNNEINALRATDRYQKASAEARETMEFRVTRKYAKERERAAIFEKASAVAGAAINTALGITKAAPNVPLMVAVGVMGAIQAGIIAATPLPKFATGGLVGGRRHSQGGTMIEAEQGEFVMNRNAVDAIGVESLNRMNQSGGGAVSVTFTGNVMSQDFIEQEAIPQIKEAIRRGADIGVS